MKFVDNFYGTCLYLNGQIVGWVTKSINGKFYYGMNGQKSTQKTLTGSYHQAKLELLKAIGD